MCNSLELGRRKAIIKSQYCKYSLVFTLTFRTIGCESKAEDTQKIKQKLFWKISSLIMFPFKAVIQRSKNIPNQYTTR